MEHYHILLLIPLIFASTAGAAECENGWVTYRDELCIKSFPTIFLTYDEAKSFCFTQGNEVSRSSLVMVKESEIQELLAHHTQNIFDNMWLGGRYDEDAKEFLWHDGVPLEYTNWQEDSPRNESDSNVCIEMASVNTKTVTSTPGKWADVNCQKRNVVVCQRILSWTLQDAVSEIQKLRRQLGNAFEEIRTVNSRVVPVGSIYIEYFNQPSPVTLWPSLSWEDVSSTYAGQFFRASGGASGSWGEVQTACAPRISRVNLHLHEVNYSTSITVDYNGWSEYLLSGAHDDPVVGTRVDEKLRIFSEGCEVRPTNQAIRIWKRMA